MEMFGIMGAVPATFIATAIYLRLIRFVLRYQLVCRILFWSSSAILIGLFIEWCLLLTIGPLRGRAIIGPTFYPIHSAFFFLAIPAFANVLMIKKSGTRLGSWFMIAFLCSMFAVPVVLTQYGVSEALYGINGIGGPFGDAPTIPIPGW